MDVYEEQRLRLKEIRNALGLSQAQFSAKLPYPLSSIAAIEAGNQKLPAALAFKLQDSIVSDKNGHTRIVTSDNPKLDEEYFLRAEWLFRGTGEPFDFGGFSSSLKSLNLPVFNENYSIKVPMEDIIFYPIKDDTMSDVFLKRDIVAVNTKNTKILSGQIYLVQVFNEYLLRVVFALDEQNLLLSPINKSIAPDLTVSCADVEIIGRYQYLIRNDY